MHGSDDRSIRVLFVCMHNSVRSRMAEAYANAAAGGALHAESAGLLPRDADAMALKVMKEDGIELGDASSDSLRRLREKGRRYDYVVCVGERELASRCPVFPGNPRHLFWPFPDPRAFSGSRSEKLEKFRRLRDQIKSRVSEWVECVGKGLCPAEKVIPFQPLPAGGGDEKQFPLR